jgi:FSR family fosmidomycin resistance protein-like MFS transporter
MPGQMGMISGLFFRLAFVMAVLDSEVLGNLLINQAAEYVYKISSFLPLIGVINYFFLI